MEKSKEISDIGTAVASQSTQAVLEAAGWVKGRVFNRKNADNYPQGYGIFTGDWGFSEDYTLKFTDGREFLHNYCTLVEVADPEVAWFTNLEVNRMQKDFQDFIELITKEYQKIYTKATQR